MQYTCDNIDPLKHAGVLHISLLSKLRSTRLRLHKPGSTQVQHGAALAPDADLVASAGEGLDWAWRAEEGDCLLLAIIGLTISMVHEHQVVLRRDQEVPGALLGSSRRLGEGELLAWHLGVGCASRDIPELGRTIAAT